MVSVGFFLGKKVCICSSYHAFIYHSYLIHQKEQQRKVKMSNLILFEAEDSSDRESGAESDDGSYESSFIDDNTPEKSETPVSIFLFIKIHCQ